MTEGVSAGRLAAKTIDPCADEHAAMIRLAANFEAIRDRDGIDRFHWINDRHVLDVGQIDPVARQVRRA